MHAYLISVKTKQLLSGLHTHPFPYTGLVYGGMLGLIIWGTVLVSLSLHTKETGGSSSSDCSAMGQWTAIAKTVVFGSWAALGLVILVSEGGSCGVLFGEQEEWGGEELSYRQQLFTVPLAKGRPMQRLLFLEAGSWVAPRLLSKRDERGWRGAMRQLI